MTDELQAKLRALRLPRLAKHWDQDLQEAARQRMSHAALLTHIVEEEYRLQGDRARQQRLRRARLPEPWTIETFPFDRQPKLNRKAIFALYDTLDFLAKAQNIIWLGRTGCGKTGLASSFLVGAIQRGATGRYVLFADLVAELYQAVALHAQEAVLQKYLRWDLLLIDEIGYVEVEPVQVGLFFTLMQKRHRKKSTLLTSNLGFSDWGSFLKNDHLTAALIDRLTETSHVFNLRECVTLRGKLSPRPMTWQERANRLRALPLSVVLRRSGAVPDRADPHKWHTAQGVLSVTGAQFINWNLGGGGGGAIDLVMHLHGVGFGQALEWLERHGATSPIPPVSPPPRPPLRLPEPTPEHLAHVRRYLVEPRRLPPALLDPLIATGNLYADARANAVFLLRGPDGQPVGAELRGTGLVPWRGMAPGSRKDRGCFAVPTTPRAVSLLCESAIDALSCHALHPDARCLSTAGARPDPVWLADLLAQGGTVSCGFDLDATGEAMAQVMIARHPAIQRLRPSHKDWNDVLRAGG